MKTVNIHEGDCLQILKQIPDNSVDSIVTDPPYGLSFMGKRWDYDVPSEEIWRECLRVLKPGGNLLAFAGTRTQHRMAVRIEDAGFDIRDMIAWVYGSGFPKSLDVSKAIDKAAGAEREVLGQKVTGNAKQRTSATGEFADGKHGGQQIVDVTAHAPATDAARQWQGWGTALKPALEPITVARKPLIGTVAENVLTHGTGAINVDGCRVDGRERTDYGLANSTRSAGNTYGGPSASADFDASKGRWPANLIHDGSDEVLAGFPVLKGAGSARAAIREATEAGMFGLSRGDGHRFGDAGSAARFFKECNQWQDQDLPRSSADIAEQSLSLQSLLAVTVQNAAAIWPSLAGILSSEQTGRSTSATPSESSAIGETAMQAMASIGSGCSPESQHERRTQCGSLVKTAAAISPTGIMTITTSLCRSDGNAEAVTFTITPTNLDRGVRVSRFNYCAKASKSDRGEGNTHPTVKPTDLMRYLCRLVTPPGGVVLDPFMGSGSTGKAAVMEGFDFIGIDMEPTYVEIAKARIEAVKVKE